MEYKSLLEIERTREEEEENIAREKLIKQLLS